jgi:hypothetical protein
MSIEILLLIALLAVTAGAGYLLFQGYRRNADREAAKREFDDLDTVAGWPPEVTRLLSGGERAAHQTLVKALPECLIFSQVSLARFIRVPRRYSYAEWLMRVGHLSADFLICSRASLVIGVVSLQAAQESERATRRRARMARVLKAAGVKVFVWRELAIPDPETARNQVLQRAGELITSSVTEEAESPKQLQPAASRHEKIPVPEVLADLPADGPGPEPPSSTWFDNLDSAAPPLDAERKRPGA